MNRWIVSRHYFREHKTLEAAQAEHRRLSDLLKGAPLHIYRIKNCVEPDEGERIHGEEG